MVGPSVLLVRLIWNVVLFSLCCYLVLHPPAITYTMLRVNVTLPRSAQRETFGFIDAERHDLMKVNPRAFYTTRPRWRRTFRWAGLRTAAVSSTLASFGYYLYWYFVISQLGGSLCGRLKLPRHPSSVIEGCKFSRTKGKRSKVGNGDR